VTTAEHCGSCGRSLTCSLVVLSFSYTGHKSGVLSGCQNDVKNMVDYIKNVHGFEDDNITLLLDDGEHTSPTHENIMSAYKKVVSESESGDAIFLHYSGHGSKVKDDERNEDRDGYDETLVPLDYETAGMIRDDDIYAAIVKPMAEGVHVVMINDCCHSGSICDLP
jgi:metacaspase-1